MSETTPLLTVPQYTSSLHAARHTDHYLYNQLIPYLGNKRKLLGLITRAVTGTTDGKPTPGHPKTFVDLFAGSGAVSRLAKWLGFRVISNDWEPYALEINRCFIECSRPARFAKLGGPGKVFQMLNSLPPLQGYFATYYAPRDDANPDPRRERMFFTQANACRLDGIRQRIQQWETDGMLSAPERSCLLAPLVYSVSYVSNTSGVFKGFHCGWGGAGKIALYRILSDLQLVRPVLHDSGIRGHRVLRQDANTLAPRLKGADIVYLDPPYNQHPYGANYHLLNTVVLNDKPSLERSILIDGVKTNKSAIRTDWRTQRKSQYCIRARALTSLTELIENLDAPHILISYSGDGFISYEEIVDMLIDHGNVTAYHKPYKRYRVSPTRPSPRSHTRETVFALEKQGLRGMVIDIDVP